MRSHRWVLVAATLLGVVAMHGVGSHGVHSAEADLVPMAHSSAVPDHMAASTTAETASPGPTHEGGFGPEVWCVAILVGFVVALRQLRRAWSTADQLRQFRRAYSLVRPRARGPDPPTLAELSILRC